MKNKGESNYFKNEPIIWKQKVQVKNALFHRFMPQLFFGFDQESQMGCVSLSPI